MQGIIWVLKRMRSLIRRISIPRTRTGTHTHTRISESRSSYKRASMARKMIETRNIQTLVDFMFILLIAMNNVSNHFYRTIFIFNTNFRFCSSAPNTTHNVLYNCGWIIETRKYFEGFLQQMPSRYKTKANTKNRKQRMFIVSVERQTNNQNKNKYNRTELNRIINKIA